MKKPKLSGKIILKLLGALFALSYLGFCLYAGITDDFPDMHRAEHVMHFRNLKNWVSGGITAVIIFTWCVTSAFHDLNFQNKHKNSFSPVFFTIILPTTFLLLLEAYLDIGWMGIVLYASITAFLFGVAWIPQILNQQIAGQLFRKELISGKQKVQIIEWIHFYPLKKLLILGLWSFGVVLVLRGIWVTAIGKIEPDGELVLFLLSTAVLVVALFQKMKRYVCTSCRNIPVLNQILSKSQLEQLLDWERFEPVSFEDHALKRYLNIYQSQNWMLIGGKLLSKKLALCVTMDRSKSDTTLNVLYLNGMTAKTKVNLVLRENQCPEFTSVLQELVGCKDSLKLHGKEEQLAQKFASFFPEQNSDHERIIMFLSQDVTQIRQDYIQTFSSPANPRKKKRSR